jgi:hypothetical protein
MNIPYLELAIASDKLRPGLSVVWVKKDETFASDAHIMVVHRTSALFGDVFVDELPAKGIVLTPRMVKDIRKKDVDSIHISEDGKSLMLLPDIRYSNERPTIIYRLPEMKDYGTQVNYRAITPKYEDSSPIKEIKIDPILIERISKAITPCNRRQFGLHFCFRSPEKGVLVVPKHDDLDGYELSYGVLMPMML